MTEKTDPGTGGKLSGQQLVSAMYCRKCRDVCLGEICGECGGRAARTEGTIEEYKQVSQALLDNRGDWRGMLESMIRE